MEYARSTGKLRNMMETGWVWIALVIVSAMCSPAIFLPVGAFFLTQPRIAIHFQTGVNYLSASNQFYQNDSVTSADFAYFKANNVSLISVRIFWKDIVFANGTFNTVVLGNFERLLTVAYDYNISVQIDLWTQFGSSWSTPPFINNIYDIVQNATARNLWFQFVNYTVTQFKIYPAVTSYTMMNEPYITNTATASLFYTTWQQQYALMKKIDPTKLIGIRFALAMSPFSGNFSMSQVVKVSNFIGINEYLDPSNSSSTRYDATWAMFNTAVIDCKNYRIPLRITEFGTDTGTLQAKQVWYQKSLALFKSKGITIAMGFAWQSTNPQVLPFNLATGIASGTPAFYQLGKYVC